MIEPLETPEFAASSEPTVLNEILLADIWRAFVIYDRSATNTQKRFIFLRLLILRLSIIVTFLAVLHSQFPNLLEINTPFLVDFSADLPSKVDLLQSFVIVAPITVSILLAGTIKFGRGVSWILLRASAETIKQEIYRYRTQVGNYSDPDNRDIHFAQVIQMINERLMKTQVNQGCLAWNQVKIADRKSLATTIHGAIGDQDKDPFSALTADQYREYRALNQLNWYRKKTLDLDKKWQQWQWSIYVLGGVGTFLAAIKWDIWIALSNAISASILSFLEFRRFDGTLIGYNQTATNLENILCWWHALTKEFQADPKNIEKLVESSEKVIQAETTGWVQEMKDAMADLYKIDEEADKNGDERADGNTKSVNLEEVPKQKGAGPSLSSIDS